MARRNSLGMLQQLISMQSSMRNAEIQKMGLAQKTIEFNDYMQKLPEQRKLKESQFHLSKLKTEVDTVNTLGQIPEKLQDPEMRANINTAMRHHAQQAMSSQIHFDDPQLASMAPASNAQQESIKQNSLEYEAMLLKDNGAPVDQIELHRQNSANINASAKGQEESDGTYKIVDDGVASFMAKNYPDYDTEDSSVLDGEVPVDVRMSTFGALFEKNFKDVENSSGMTFDQRFEATMNKSAAEFKFDSPAEAHVMAKFAGESIANYRTSEQTKYAGMIGSFNDLNLVEARDGLMKVGYDMAQLNPTDMVTSMQSSIGYSKMTEIARAVDMQGDDTMLFSQLNKTMTNMNPAVFGTNVTEAERKLMVQKNIGDALIMSVADSGAPIKQKLASIKIMKEIDGQVDKGQIDPELRTLYDHLYGRWLQGYSGLMTEDSQKVNAIKSQGRGVMRDMNQKMVITANDFSALPAIAKAQGASTDRAQYYADTIAAAPSAAGWEFVRESADPDFDKSSGKGSVLGIGFENMQFYAGGYGDNNISPGLIKVTNHLKSGGSTDAIMKSPEGQTVGRKIMRNIAKIEAYNTTIDEANVQVGSGNNRKKLSVTAGLTMESGKGNPIDAAGLELEKFGNSYMPEAALKSLMAGDSPEIANMFKAMKNSDDVREIAAGYVHMTLYGAQAGADHSAGMLVSSAKHVYPGISITSDGKLPNIMRQSARGELSNIAESIPFALNDRVTTIYSDMQDDIEKYTLDLEDRIAYLSDGLTDNDDYYGEDMQSLFAGSYTDQAKTDTKNVIDLLKDMHDVTSKLSTMRLADGVVDLKTLDRVTAPDTVNTGDLGLSLASGSITDKHNKRNKKLTKMLLKDMVVIRNNLRELAK